MSYPPGYPGFHDGVNPFWERTRWPGSHMLFVCQANVGRSQMAQGIFKTAFPYVVAESAGIDDITERYSHPHPAVVEEMLSHGIDISNQIVKPLRDEMVTPQTDVVVFCETSNFPIGLWKMHGQLYRITYLIRLAPEAVMLHWKICSLTRLMTSTFIHKDLREILLEVNNHTATGKKIDYKHRYYKRPVDLPAEFPFKLSPWERLEDYKL